MVGDLHCCLGFVVLLMLSCSAHRLQLFCSDSCALEGASVHSLALPEAHLHRKALRDIKRAERKMRLYAIWALDRCMDLRLPERGRRLSTLSL
jgi:hypothetical protein